MIWWLAGVELRDTKKPQAAPAAKLVMVAFRAAVRASPPPW